MDVLSKHIAWQTLTNLQNISWYTSNHNTFPTINTKIERRELLQFFNQRLTIGHHSDKRINTCEQSNSHRKPFRNSPNLFTFTPKSTWQHFLATKSVLPRFLSMKYEISRSCHPFFGVLGDVNIVTTSRNRFVMVHYKNVHYT